MKKRGFDVLGYDVNSIVKKKIAETIGNTSVAYDYNEIASCDSIHICVPTEPSTDGSADMSIYDNVIDMLISVLDIHRPISVIQRSTCPPGSADKYAKCFGNNISYGVNPSFLRKASIKQDTEYPERVAIGGEGLCVEHLKKIYHSINAPKYITTCRTSVELLKYVENTLDAMLISYWNEILEYAGSLNIDDTEIIRLIERIGDRKKFKTVSRVPGMAFGLWCLPKDLNALIVEMKKKGVSVNLMEGILATNIEFERKVGIGLVPAKSLWKITNDNFCILEDGINQISSFVKKVK